MTWQDFENKVRAIASYRWNCSATTETICGVKCDCVLKPQADEWIIIEITQQSSINKVRDDISKLLTVRNHCFLLQIYCKCYFVMQDTPTDAMRSAGTGQNVYVRSMEEFQNEYFAYTQYIYFRSQKQFGSLINSENGEPENNTYVEVSYSNIKTNEELHINDIVSQLRRGKRVVLKGDFGVGKSRCVKKIFDDLTFDSIQNPYVIAINLREHWGAKYATEILRRHFEDLGLTANDFIKTYNQPNVIYLLDGFDEIGTQSWSSDIHIMRHMREMSVCALKDLIHMAKGGVLITGREYYFNSDEELMDCLGLTKENTVFLECHDEFDDDELIKFFSENTTNGSIIGKDEIKKLPSWFPKRPLIVQLLMKYANEVLSVKHAFDDICNFWYAFFGKVCEREANIYPALNPKAIEKVLLILADQTRISENNTGPITQKDLSDAFFKATGFYPNDESSIMLQRLPSLGRISADSPNRQFLDSFFLNGLRAESIIQQSKSWTNSDFSAPWRYPLDETGISILSMYIGKDEHRIETFLSLARTASLSSNKVLASDIVSALCMIERDIIDFKNLSISDGSFSYLTFEGKEIRNLSITESTIEKLDITNSKLDNTVRIQNCLINTIFGIASGKSIPSRIQDCIVETYETLATTTLIKRAKLSEPQKFLAEMLRKIFFQPGSGRKEAALLRGMGISANKPLGQKILSILMDEKLIIRAKGDEGYIYRPIRSNTSRVDKILTDLTLSEDVVWERVSSLDK